MGSEVFEMWRRQRQREGQRHHITSTAAIHQPMALDLFLLSTRLAAQSLRQSQGESGFAACVCAWRFLLRVAVVGAENEAGADDGEDAAERDGADPLRRCLIGRIPGISRRREGPLPKKACRKG